MFSQRITITNAEGLHARPAHEFIACAKQFQSKITINRTGGGTPVNGKSLVLLLSLSATRGTEVLITAEGEDESVAIATLIQLIKFGLGE
mgnify:FL=1